MPKYGRTSQTTEGMAEVWIKLISPKVTMRPMDSAFKMQMSPPLALLVLGALTPHQHKVTVCDENIERLDLRDNPDLVGITARKVFLSSLAAFIRPHVRRRVHPMPTPLSSERPNRCGRTFWRTYRPGN